jgi:CO dehydrogenase maturation factor
VLAGNKVQTDEDVAFLRRHAGGDLLTWFGHEPAVWAMEQGRPFGLADLSAQTRAALAVVQAALDARSPDWARYARQAAEFHLKNARAWASAAVGQDLTEQIDPGFTLDPRTSQIHFLTTGHC